MKKYKKKSVVIDAFKERLSELGYTLSEEASDCAFQGFKELADKKKEV